MRAVVLQLLMLVMLVPSMACAAEICAVMDLPAQEREQAQGPGRDMPCHDQKKTGPGKDDALMMFKDCAGVDLAPAGHATMVQKPDMQIDKLVFALTNTAPIYDFIPLDVRRIRGPPTKKANTPATYPALYLTTQRLRI